MDITDLMTTRVFTCDPRDSLNRAAQLMWDHNCSCVPIVDGDQKLIGLVTERDVAMAAYTQGRRLSEISVLDAMSRKLHACEAGCAYETVEKNMQRLGISRMPVIDDRGRLIGLFTKTDVGRAGEVLSDELPSASLARPATATTADLRH